MNFSVLMSVYAKDNALFFKDALESVTTHQTLKPSQVVIVKDGLVGQDIDDVIEKISAENKDISIDVVAKPENKGLAAALNSGIGVCKYDWIIRMDSDDISAEDRFEKQISYLKEHPNVDALGGAISEFAEIPGDIKSERHVPVSHNGIRNMAKVRTPMNHVTVAFSKKAVEEMGGYSENFGKLEDYKLWVDMISHNKELCNLDDVLVYVRIGNGFIERRSNKREIADWDMLQTYLLRSNIVTKWEAIKNKVYIRAFIYMPSCIKRLVYKFVLRK